MVIFQMCVSGSRGTKAKKIKSFPMKILLDSATYSKVKWDFGKTTLEWLLGSKKPKQTVNFLKSTQLDQKFFNF